MVVCLCVHRMLVESTTKQMPHSHQTVDKVFHSVCDRGIGRYSGVRGCCQRSLTLLTPAVISM